MSEITCVWLNKFLFWYRKRNTSGKDDFLRGGDVRTQWVTSTIRKKEGRDILVLLPMTIKGCSKRLLQVTNSWHFTRSSTWVQVQVVFSFKMYSYVSHSCIIATRRVVCISHLSIFIQTPALSGRGCQYTAKQPNHHLILWRRSNLEEVLGVPEEWITPYINK